MEAFVLTFMTLFSIVEREFFDQAVTEQKMGFEWEQIECKTPDPDSKSIVFTTGTGKEFVCFKLM